ncbi:hypothetical protein M2318_001856 [Metapseudomonas resinovorans]
MAKFFNIFSALKNGKSTVSDLLPVKSRINGMLAN